jgi:steroid delta-isomerase
MIRHMPGPAVDIIRQFATAERDQRYSKLLPLFAPDAVYYDAFMGTQRGTDEIARFMGHMERIVPKMQVRFDEWEIEADRTVGWARWNMIAPNPDGVEVAVPGQSLYRLNADGLVTYVCDYVDSRAYRKLAPTAAPPNVDDAAGWSIDARNVHGPAVDVVRRFWQIQNDARYTELGELFTEDAVFTDIVYGRFEGRDAVVAYLSRMETEMPEQGARFELIDAAGDETVAWSQWWCHLPTGKLAGWTLHTLRDGRLTLDADYFDVLAARRLNPAG